MSGSDELHPEPIVIEYLPPELDQRIDDLRARRAAGHAPGCACRPCIADREALGAAEVLDLADDPI